MRPLGWASKATSSGGGDGEEPPDDWEKLQKAMAKRGRLQEQDKKEMARLTKAKTKALLDDALADIGKPLTGMTTAMLENECLRLLQGILADCGSGPTGRGPTREPFPAWPAAPNGEVELIEDDPPDNSRRILLSRRADPADASKPAAAAAADPWTGR